MPPTKADQRRERRQHHDQPDRADPGGKIGLGPRHGDETVEERGQRHEGPHPPRRLNADQRRAETGRGVGGDGELREFQPREIGRSDGVAELVVKRAEDGRSQGRKREQDHEKGQFSEAGHGRAMRRFVDVVTGQPSGTTRPAKARMPAPAPPPSSFEKYA
jgi:hypothetical protein